MLRKRRIRQKTTHVLQILQLSNDCYGYCYECSLGYMQWALVPVHARETVGHQPPPTITNPPPTDTKHHYLLATCCNNNNHIAVGEAHKHIEGAHIVPCTRWASPFVHLLYTWWSMQKTTYKLQAVPS